MKFNNNKFFSAKRKSTITRIGVVFLISIIAIILWTKLIPQAQKIAGALEINELIASITLLISLSTIVIKISEKILQQNYTSKRRILLETLTNGEYTTVTCKIENCGSKRIVPQNIYLMVEQGIEKEDVITFPYLLKHEEGEFDCVFANLCKKGGFSCLPEHLLQPEFKGLYRKIIKMQHLSSETILFVDPGEEFSEDITMKLKKGVYKATVVWTSVHEDCICATKEFIVYPGGERNA